MKTQTKIRSILLTLLLVLPVVVALGDTNLENTAQTGANSKSTSMIKWKKYDEGMAVGKSQGKKIFVNFYADWCQYCKIMESQTFRDKDVVNYINTNFVPIKVNSDLEQKTASTYNVRGLPTTLFLSEKGERIGLRPGFISAEELLLLLRYVGTGSYENMSLERFAQEQPATKK